MTEKMATREAYGKTLVELGKRYDNLVVMDADLSGSTKTGEFKKVFPERFFNMGIAEQDLYGTAAGLAISGKVVCASTFAMFASGRAFEIIRNSIGYTGANVKICATHAGITVGEDGVRLASAATGLRPTGPIIKNGDDIVGHTRRLVYLDKSQRKSDSRVDGKHTCDSFKRMRKHLRQFQLFFKYDDADYYDYSAHTSDHNIFRDDRNRNDGDHSSEEF